AADRGQVAGGQELRHDRRVGGQETVRAELGGGEAYPGHLGQDACGRELVAPPGYLTYAPGDGRACDLVNGAGHQRISFVEKVYLRASRRGRPPPETAR